MGHTETILGKASGKLSPFHVILNDPEKLDQIPENALSCRTPATNVAGVPQSNHLDHHRRKQMVQAQAE
jgi:hypothetical protein